MVNYPRLNEPVFLPGQLLKKCCYMTDKVQHPTVADRNDSVPVWKKWGYLHSRTASFLNYHAISSSSNKYCRWCNYHRKTFSRDFKYNFDERLHVYTLGCTGFLGCKFPVRFVKKSLDFYSLEGINVVDQSLFIVGRGVGWVGGCGGSHGRLLEGT